MKQSRYGGGGFRSAVCDLRSGRRGFTLVELLVVVAVIGILMAILMPAIGRVQERGREMRCSSNLRQLHTAAMSYMNAHGNFPQGTDRSVYARGVAPGQGGSATNGWVASIRNGERNAAGHAWWYERNAASTRDGTRSVRQGNLFRYVGDEGDESVYVCPTMARLARRTLAGERRTVTRSYGMNSNIIRGDDYVPKALHEIEGPSRTMLFADQGFTSMAGRPDFLNGADAGPDDLAPPGASNPYWNSNRLYYRRYNMRANGVIDIGREWIGAYHGPRAGVENLGRANVVFVDGHVEQVEYRYTDHVARGNWEDGRPLTP